MICTVSDVGGNVATVADGIGEKDVEMDALSRANDTGDGSNPDGGCMKQILGGALVKGDCIQEQFPMLKLSLWC